MSHKILVVDDDDVTRKLLKEILEKEGYDIRLAESGEVALKWIQKEFFPVILSDIRMFDVSGMTILKTVKLLDKVSLVILMTSFGSMEGAVQAIQGGAYDYVSKPFEMNDLKLTINRAFKHWESIQEAKKIESSVQLVSTTKNLIGKSPKILEVYKTLARAAMSSSTVLITGESGTGKELVAKAIHSNSLRSENQFVAVNCGALTESLLESELFGHVKGSFTGAQMDKPGLFNEANEGTLFLDEIGDISPALQIKLLRVLQEGEIKAVGSISTHHVDVRLIAATHRNLDSLVKEGKFREDLYYRLKVISIELPPLRDRMSDLTDLVEYFLNKYSLQNSKQISHVSFEAMDILKKYIWPGNIRELENVIERAVAMTRTSILFPEDFPSELLNFSSLSHSLDPKKLQKPSLDNVEKDHIIEVLQEVKYNKSKASHILGIDRVTLYRKAQKYGIELKK